MRVYHKFIKSALVPSKIVKQGEFVTWCPNSTINNLDNHDLTSLLEKECSASPLMNKIITDKHLYPNIRYGRGITGNVSKYWISPYGNQLQFTDNLPFYKPFIDEIHPITDAKNRYDQGILHYLGYFTQHNIHQVYFYLGKTLKEPITHLDYNLQQLLPDYFGYSLTFDNKWNIIKVGTYAVRVPYENCSHLLDGIPIENSISNYYNISYRQWFRFNIDSSSRLCDFEDELGISYLVKK